MPAILVLHVVVFTVMSFITFPPIPATTTADGRPKSSCRRARYR